MEEEDKENEKKEDYERKGSKEVFTYYSLALPIQVSDSL